MFCIDISRIMAKSRDWDELQWVWVEWRRRSGSQIRELYGQLIHLNNDVAEQNSELIFLTADEMLIQI